MFSGPTALSIVLLIDFGIVSIFESSCPKSLLLEMFSANFVLVVSVLLRFHCFNCCIITSATTPCQCELVYLTNGVNMSVFCNY